jgi:hypothetical protein
MVLGLQRKKYSLREAITPIPMDQLTAKIPVATKTTATEKVPPMVEAEIRSQDYTTVDFDLWKNVGHIAVADESQMKSAINVLNLNINDVARDLERLINKQIDEALDASITASGNTSAGSDWGGSNNPYDDIMTAVATIEGTNDHEPDTIIAHPYVWTDFFGNDYVKGQLAGEVLPSGKVFDVPGLPGWRGISDWSPTNTSAFIMSRSAPCLVMGEGPTMAASYRDEKAGFDGYIIRQWVEPKSVQDGALYELTAVHA